MVKGDLWHEINSRFKLKEIKESIARAVGLREDRLVGGRVLRPVGRGRRPDRLARRLGGCWAGDCGGAASQRLLYGFCRSSEGAGSKENLIEEFGVRERSRKRAL